MGHPQLGFPRLRFVTGSAGGITIGPDHTPSWVTVLQNPRTGGAWFAGAGGVVIFSGGMAVSVEICGDAWRFERIAVIHAHLSIHSAVAWTQAVRSESVSVGTPPKNAM